MPSNRSFSRDARAEVGIGTMIVFIATILVSAIAAGVLISTSQKLQAKSQQTGSEAIQNVAGAITVVGVTGVRSNTTAQGNIDQIDITIRLSAGADQLDLKSLVMTFDDGQQQVAITSCAIGGSVGNATEFAMDILRGTINDCGVMSAGDLVVLHLGKAASSGAVPIVTGGLPTNRHVVIQYIPGHGVLAESAFTTPAYGASSHVALV